MGIGGSIFLLAVGAILTFAVHGSLGIVDIQVVGWVLMAAGVLGLILTTYFWNSRRRRVVTSGTAPAATYPRERVVVDEPVDDRIERY
jgi:Domain of unknown function (DUF6458)